MANEGTGSEETNEQQSGSSNGALTVNSQILDAVDKTNAVVAGAAQEQGEGISYQKVAQAAAFSVQDSSDYFRNVMSMATAAQGICMQKMIAEQTPEQYATIMEKAQAAVTAAQDILSSVGTDSANVMSKFPS